ncbi:MAG TPA: glutamine--scyllo-inositol aminotransferase, partial [Porphyromonadaceae bacterium]|nr:glutamine--scyllo-inositol aminotransferase [Porphyromonadaceae bacterium]
MIVTSGTTTGKIEEKYVVDAVKNLGDPEQFNFYIKTFEKRFAEYIGAKYAIATVNGTSALHTGLLALGIGKGDEVILPDMTYVACANVIAYTGAEPVFVDINPETWCVDPVSIKKAISKRTKAIMPVWMYGNVPDMEQILAVAGEIPIIEDSCPAVGSYWKKKHAGTIGAIGCFSFQGAKILAIGEGGMMVTDDKKIYEQAKLFVDMYTTKEFWQTKIGYMYEMNNVSAAVGLGQLERINEFLIKKQLIYQWYREELSSLCPMNYCSDENSTNYWMSSIIVPSQLYRINLRK